MGRAVVVKVPDIGEGIAEVELVAWHVRPGDRVAEDQAVADLMTDKATVEVPSPVAGTVLALGGEVGQMLAVGAELVRLGAAPADGASQAPRSPAAPVAPTPPAAPAAPASASAAAPAAPPGAKSAPAPGMASRPQRTIASPAVRARAWELGIDLAHVAGSGTAGRIVHADLDAAAARGARAPRPAPRAASAGAINEVKIVGLRRKIAQRMQESKRRIPHFSYVEEVDVGELEALRARLNARSQDPQADALRRPPPEGGEQTSGGRAFPQGRRAHLTLLPFLVRAIVLALQAHPQVNARFDDEAGVLAVHDAVHLGIATSTEAGLLVPVLRNAQDRDLWGCAAETARLAAGARAGKLTRDELAGSTITLSSLGKLGGIAATPVINYPEVAIVGVNRIVERPVIRAGAVVARPIMNLSSSFDHRIVDGALAAAFVQALREYLEHPALLFVE
ncbi:MAG: 2-oxo acid dehydrogenase subunit E2 [Ideonella sp.]|nr:2-oxo acid dehydrogenase subunit E2 [Ideonella sp.]